MQKTTNKQTNQNVVKDKKATSDTSSEEHTEKNTVDSWDSLEDRFARTAKQRIMSRDLLKTLIPSLLFSLVFMFFLFANMSFINAAIASPLAAFISFFITGTLVDGEDFDAMLSGFATGIFSSVPVGFLLGLLPLSILSSALGGLPITLFSYGFLWFDLSASVGFIGGLLVILTGVMSVFSMRIGRKVRSKIVEGKY